MASLGYGLFLAINAASVWGGVFPFLPLAFQTPDVMLWFFGAESLTFAATFLASAAGTYRHVLSTIWRPALALVTMAAVREFYGLSAREAEVAELIARGHTVAHIAEPLFVSENTVRTHSKHIYVKLDIHKRQELIALVESFEPEGR